MPKKARHALADRCRLQTPALQHIVCVATKDITQRRAEIRPEVKQAQQVMAEALLTYRRMLQLATIEVNTAAKVAEQELKAFNTAIDNAVKRLYHKLPERVSDTFCRSFSTTSLILF